MLWSRPGLGDKLCDLGHVTLGSLISISQVSSPVKWRPLDGAVCEDEVALVLPGVQCCSGSICYIIAITTVILNRRLSPTGLRKNMSTRSMMSRPHPHRPMGAPPIPKHLATQTPHPRRSTRSTTRRRQGHQPCESTGASPYQPLPKPSPLPPPPSLPF